MLVDTHAHPEQQAYDSDREKIITDAINSGIGAIVAVGTNIENSKKTLSLAKKYKTIFPTVGIHPLDGASDVKKNFREEFEDLVKDDSVIAVGECGLDIYLTGETQTTEKQVNDQIELFEFQIDMAKKYDLPIIIHCRNGWDKIFEILDRKKINCGVFHCWTGDMVSAEKALERGFYIAFGGIVTFKNAGEITTVAKEMDINRMVLETDSPFLAPEGMRGSRNEPKNVRIVAQFIAELRGVELKIIEDITTENAYKLFRLNLI